MCPEGLWFFGERNLAVLIISYMGHSLGRISVQINGAPFLSSDFFSSSNLYEYQLIEELCFTQGHGVVHGDLRSAGFQCRLG